MEFGKREMLIIAILTIVFLIIHMFFMPQSQEVLVPVANKEHLPISTQEKRMIHPIEYQYPDQSLKTQLPPHYHKMHEYIDEHPNRFEHSADNIMEENRALMDPSRMQLGNNDDSDENQDVNYNEMRQRFGVDFAPPFEKNNKHTNIPSGIASNEFDHHDGTLENGEFNNEKILHDGLKPSINSDGYINQDSDDDAFQPHSH